MYLLLALVLLVLQVRSAILPSSIFTQNILFGPNQVASTQQVLSGICSETNSFGQLIIGNYQVNITCQPAQAEFDFTEICDIPQEVLFEQLVQVLVSNLTAANQAISNLNTNFQGSLRRLLSEDLNTARRGLKQGFVEKAGGKGAVIQGGIDVVLFLWDVSLQTQIGELDKAVGDLWTDVHNLTDWSVSMQNQITANLAIESQLANTVGVNYNTTQLELAAQDLALTAQQNETRILQSLADTAQANFVQLQSQTSSAIAALTGSTNTLVNNTNQQVIALANVLYNLTGSLSDQILQLQVNENIAIQNLNVRDNNLENEISNKALMFSLTNSVFKAISTLPPAFEGFFTDAGVAPSILTGENLINLQEMVSVNYVTQPTGGIYQIHNTQISFIQDTRYGIQQLVEGTQVVMPFDTIPTLFTGVGCSRAFPGTTGASPDAPSSVPCKLWVEVSDVYCNSNRYPEFNWTSTGGKSVTIPNATFWCNQGGIQGVTPVVYRDYTSFKNYVASSICPARGFPANTTIMISYFRAGTSGFANPPTDSYNCGLAWDGMKIAMTNQGVINLLLLILNGPYQSWSIANGDLIKKQLIRFGALPGGVDVAFLPYLHFPIGTNSSTGVPIYSGDAQPKVAMRGTFAAVHQNTLPVYSKVPSNNPAVLTRITVSVAPVPGFTCTNPLTCYQVGSTDVTQNIVYESNILPSQDATVFLGSLLPEVLVSQGMFDVPQSELACNQNNRLNENTLCYLRFPAGTTQTGTLPEWELFNNVVYNPLMASASATDFRFPAVFDNQGFPMCGNAIAPGSLTNLTIDIHMCNSPYTWKNATSPNLVTSTPSNAVPSECLQPGTVTLFNTFLDASYTALIGTSASAFVSSTFSEFSFWFQSSLVVQDPNAGLEFAVLEISGTGGYLRFLMDSNGNPAVVLAPSASVDTGLTWDSRSTLSTANLRDAILHQIVWQISGTGANRVLALWIDEIFQGSVSETTYVSGTVLFSQSTFALTQDLSNADFITLGLMNPTAGNVHLANSYSCQQAWFDRRCTQPAGLEALLIVRQNVTNNNNVFCDTTAMLVSTNLAFDALTSQALVGAAQLFTTTAWSLSFWVRLPVTPVTGQYLLLKNQLTSVQVSFSANLLNLYVNNVLVASLNVYSQQLSHMITLSYNGATLVTYQDGALQGSVSVTLNTGAAGSLVNNTSYNYLSMIKFYPSEALSPTQATNEMLCMVESPALPSFFVPPIGFCEQSLLDPLHGYCRSPMLCAGHCSAYSTIDSFTRTFVTGALNCDDGYQTPSCTEQCARIDPATGRCVDLTNLFSAAPVPLGTICEEALHYQIEQNMATRKITETARRWLYYFTINVPSGAVTSIVGSGACPQTTITPFGNTGALLISFLNTDTQETNIRVFYAPTSVSINNTQCTVDCCNSNTVGALFSIQPGLAASLPIPTCGDMTITIARLNSINTYITCSTLQGDSLQQALYSGASLQSAASLSAINAVVEPIANNLFNYFQLAQIASVNAQILNAGFSNATDGELQILFNIRNALEAQTFSSFNGSSFTPLQNLSSLVDAQVAAIQAQLADAQAKLAAAEASNAQIPSLLTAIYAAIKNSSAEGAANLKNLLDLQTQEAIQGAFDPSGNPLNSIGDAIAGASKTVYNAASGALSSALGGLGLLGGIGGFFGSLISTIIYVLIIAATAYAIYWLYKRSKNSNSKKPQNTEEGTPAERVPITQPAAHAQFRINRQV